MLKFLSVTLPLIILAACSNSTTNTETSTEKPGVHRQAGNTFDTAAYIVNLNGCYEMTMKQDTATLELTVQDSTVTGKLVYDWNEKDGNTGTLKGVVRGDLIYADYTFESEGMTSVREVVFKVQDSLLQQAVGDLDQQQNKIVYRNKSSLDFNVMPPFMKVDCAPKN